MNVESIKETASEGKLSLSTSKWTFDAVLEPGEKIREAELTGLKNLLGVLVVSSKPHPEVEPIEESLADGKLRLTTSRWSLAVDVGQGEKVDLMGLDTMKRVLKRLVEPGPFTPWEAWADSVRSCPATACSPSPSNATAAPGSVCHDRAVRR